MAVFFNQATLSYNNTTVNSNVVTGEIVEVLAATKSSIGNTYGLGDTVTYVVSVVNSGNTPFTGITVTDDLGTFAEGTLTLTPLDYVESSAALYIEGVLQTPPTATVTGGNLVISGINLPANSSALLIYQAKVNEFAPLDSTSTVVNTATLSGAGISVPVTASATVTVADGAELSISKSVSPAEVAENELLTYTFVIQNTGNTEAVSTDNVTVTDTFDPILENIAVTLNGATLTEGVGYTYNPATGAFATVAGQITVPAATYTRDPVTGIIAVNPGVAVLKVSGTV